MPSLRDCLLYNVGHAFSIMRPPDDSVFSPKDVKTVSGRVCAFIELGVILTWWPLILEVLLAVKRFQLPPLGGDFHSQGALSGR